MVYLIIKYYIYLFLGRFKMLVFFIGCDVRYEKKIKKNLNLNDKL